MMTEVTRKPYSDIQYFQCERYNTNNFLLSLTCLSDLNFGISGHCWTFQKPDTQGYGTHLECFHPIVVGVFHRKENGLFARRLTATKKEGRAIKRLPDSHQVEGDLREHLLPLGLARRRR